jgi:hypothetical protein
MPPSLVLQSAAPLSCGLPLKILLPHLEQLAKKSSSPSSNPYAPCTFRTRYTVAILPTQSFLLPRIIDSNYQVQRERPRRHIQIIASWSSNTSTHTEGNPARQTADRGNSVSHIPRGTAFIHSTFYHLITVSTASTSCAENSKNPRIIAGPPVVSIAGSINIFLPFLSDTPATRYSEEALIAG